MEDVNERLRRVLTVQRSAVNTAFALARQNWPQLPAEEFGPGLLRFGAVVLEALGPVDEAVEARAVQALAEALLDLYGPGYLGAVKRHPGFAAAWERLLGGFPLALAEQPARVLASLGNACLRFWQTDEAAGRRWLDKVLGLPRGLRAQELLDAAGVAAWLAGWAELRTSAGPLLPGLDDRCLKVLLGVEELPGGRGKCLESLLADPWFDPARKADKGPRILTAGGFTGYGGPFVRPPRLHAGGGQFWLTDGEGWYRLFADAFGARLLRGQPEVQLNEAKPAPSTMDKVLPPLPALFPRIWGQLAVVERTAVLTSPDSHLVFVAEGLAS